MSTSPNKLIKNVMCVCGTWLTIDRRCACMDCKETGEEREGQFVKADHENIWPERWFGNAVVFPFWAPISDEEIVKAIHGEDHS